MTSPAWQHAWLKTRRGEKRGDKWTKHSSHFSSSATAHEFTKMDKCPRLPTEDYQEALGTGERPNVLPISHSLYSKRLSFRCRGMEYTAEIWAPLVAILRYVAALLGFFFQPGNHGRCLQDMLLHACLFLCVFVCVSFALHALLNVLFLNDKCPEIPS